MTGGLAGKVVGEKMRVHLLKSFSASVKTVVDGVAVVASCLSAASMAQSNVPSGISERARRSKIKYLADESLEGRAPGSRGW